MNDYIPEASDMERIRQDLRSLYEHAGAAFGKKTADAKRVWEETRATLELKKAELEAKAAELTKSGGAASSEVKRGFGAAYAELKKAFSEAKAKFDS